MGPLALQASMGVAARVVVSAFILGPSVKMPALLSRLSGELETNEPVVYTSVAKHWVHTHTHACAQGVMLTLAVAAQRNGFHPPWKRFVVQGKSTCPQFSDFVTAALQR